MKAAIHRGKDKIQIEEVAVPGVPRNHVLVDTKVIGICGTDLHRYHGKWPQPEFAVGHEFAGVVTELGKEVSRVKVGDHVCVECFSHCGKCTFCQAGLYNLCENRVYLGRTAHAGYSEYSLVHESSLFQIPKELTFEEGAMVEPLSVALRAFLKTEAKGTDSLAILGGGTIGLLCLAVAKALGVGKTLITVKYARQTEIAEQLGADHLIDVSKGDTERKIKAIVGNVGVDACIDTVSSERTYSEALAITRAAGKVCFAGGNIQAVHVDLSPILHKELNLVGSLCYGYSGIKKDFDTTIGLIASGKVSPTSLITHRFPLEKTEEAFRVAADKTTGSIKVMVSQVERRV